MDKQFTLPYEGGLTEKNHPAGTIVCDEAAVGELKVSSYRYFKAVEAAENRL